MYTKRICPAVRFWAKVDRPGLDASVCWLWTGATIKGYGSFQPGGRGSPMLAHRWAYQWFYDELPHDLDHTCRTPRCVNPWHLRPLTRAANTQDGSRHRYGSTDDVCRNGHSGEFVMRSSAGRNPFRVCLACQRDTQRRYRERS